MKPIPTIYIHSLNDPVYRVRINEADFDPSIHKLWSDTNALQAQEAETPQTLTRDEIHDAAMIGHEALVERKTREQRESELMGLYYGESGDESNWRPIRAIADPLGIVKPDAGWDEAIPLILKAEGYEA